MVRRIATLVNPLLTLAQKLDRPEDGPAELGGSARSGAELAEALGEVPKEVVLTTEKVELSPALAAFGALLLLLGVVIAARQRVFP